MIMVYAITMFSYLGYSRDIPNQVAGMYGISRGCHNGDADECVGHDRGGRLREDGLHNGDAGERAGHASERARHASERARHASERASGRLRQGRPRMSVGGGCRWDTFF